MSRWIAIDPKFHSSWLGFLPEILLADDKRLVKEQLEDRYRHGGGWRPIKGFKMKGFKTTGGKVHLASPSDLTLRFPGDSPFKPAAMTQIGDEVVVFYLNCSLLAVIQKDGSFEVTRVD